ncbi:MAG: hypothetical protein IH991_16055 [Planctomycetes bacterium]|nr:hypothetical protein [Planctomycetota bacterium]
MNFSSNRRVWFVLGILVLCLLLQTVAMACPTCQAGLEGAEHENIKRGYFWSILFMMSMPFLIFIGMGIYFYLKVRKARAQAVVPISAMADEQEVLPPGASVETVAEEEELVEV